MIAQSDGCGDNTHAQWWRCRQCAAPDVKHECGHSAGLFCTKCNAPVRPAATGGSDTLDTSGGIR